MTYKVIVQFSNYTDRDDWAKKLNTDLIRVYERNPWLAANLSNDEVRQLEQQTDVKIFPDTAMTPAVKLIKI